MPAFCPVRDPLFDFLRVLILYCGNRRTDELEAELPNTIYQTKVAE